MRQMSQKVLTVGIVMLTSGLIFPWIVGSLIPAWGYNVLQLGGIALTLIGGLVRVVGKRGGSP